MIPRQHLRALFSDLLSDGSARATMLKRGDVSAGVSKLGQICLTLLLK